MNNGQQLVDTFHSWPSQIQIRFLGAVSSGYFHNTISAGAVWHLKPENEKRFLLGLYKKVPPKLFSGAHPGVSIGIFCVTMFSLLSISVIVAYKNNELSTKGLLASLAFYGATVLGLALYALVIKCKLPRSKILQQASIIRLLSDADTQLDSGRFPTDLKATYNYHHAICQYRMQYDCLWLFCPLRYYLPRIQEATIPFAPFIPAENEVLSHQHILAGITQAAPLAEKDILVVLKILFNTKQYERKIRIPQTRFITQTLTSLHQQLEQLRQYWPSLLQACQHLHPRFMELALQGTTEQVRSLPRKFYTHLLLTLTAVVLFICGLIASTSSYRGSNEHDSQPMQNGTVTAKPEFDGFLERRVAPTHLVNMIFLILGLLLGAIRSTLVSRHHSDHAVGRNYRILSQIYPRHFTAQDHAIADRFRLNTREMITFKQGSLECIKEAFCCYRRRRAPESHVVETVSPLAR